MRTKIEQLQEEAFKLHSRITAETHVPTKKRLISQRAKVVQQIQGLKLKAIPEKEKQASQVLDELFRSEKVVCVLTINGIRTEPDEDLNVTLTFLPCKHELSMHMKELFHRYRRHAPQSEQYLLNKWRSSLTPNTIMEARYNCPKCREAKEKKFKLFRRHSPKDTIGTVQVVLKVI